MKTTASTLTGWIAVAMGLSAGMAWAGPLGGGPEILLSTASIAQADGAGAQPVDKRQQAADLLRRAREAMDANDLAAAETLIAKAELLGVQYSPLHIGDTPKKARRDLDTKRKSLKASPTRPSQQFTPSATGSGGKIPDADPFARRGAAGAAVAAAPGAPDRRAVTPLPPVDQSSPVPSLPSDDLANAPSPFGRAINTSPADDVDPGLPSALTRRVAAGAGASGAVGRATVEDLPAGADAALSGAAAGPVPDSSLRAARRALAVGDVRRATAMVQQARSQNRRYGPLDDTPEKVEAAIRNYQDVTSQQSNTEGYRRAYARMLLEQSVALVRTGDYNEAEQLATEASRQRASYAPFEMKPDELLARIAAARRGARAEVSNIAALTTGEMPGANSLAAKSPAAGSAKISPAAQREAAELIRQACEALASGQLNWAESLARGAELLRLPDTAYAAGQTPGEVLLEIRRAKDRQAGGPAPGGVVPAGAVMPATGTSDLDRRATRAVYDAANDSTRNVPAQHEEPSPPRQLDFAQTPTPAPAPATGPAPAPPRADEAPPAGSPLAGAAAPAERVGPRSESIGMSLFRQGEQALKNREKDRAYQLFQQAARYQSELDPATAQRLQGYLQLLTTPAKAPAGPGPAPSLADDTAAKQSVLVRQVASDVAHQEANARAMRETNPKGAMTVLEEARKKVETSNLDPAVREPLLRKVDRALAETRQYIDDNRPRIELEEQNARIRQDVDRQQQVTLQVQDKLAQMVNQYNQLMDEQRYAEAEVIAKQAAELDPKNPVVQQLLIQAKFVRRYMNQKATRDEKEDMFVRALDSVERSDIPFDDMNPYQHGDVKRWAELTKSRGKMIAERNRRRSERDLEIERKLKTPVSVQFDKTALSTVLDQLAKLADINMHLDPQGIAQEGVSSDTPVTIEIRHEIMLKSALNLILQPLHLSYVVKDEVLNITSEQHRDGQTYVQIYNVADLVVPIPNFVASPRMGLAGAYHDALGNVGYGGGNPFGTATTPLSVVATKDGKQNSAVVNPAVLAQMSAHSPTSGSAGNNLPISAGPGSLGGGTQADFDSLINLITTTVHPTTWDDVGGPGSIAPFETNLSIVVSQTQEVHEEIVDLLEQLRRMQDLQVTIEVRFITLNDNFFERIGVDFNFRIDSNIAGSNKAFGQVVNGAPNVADRDDENNKNVTVGLAAPGVFQADLDIPFSQNSFGLTEPQFGGFAADAGATLGFAILSDIEAFFFINAAQADRRSNVLQAPKVTLFNGQQAFISDSSQSPFVISVVPVVGDFAAAQQPVIVVLSEGTHLTVQAVVSPDRRFVRLTVVPFFSKIGADVKTFQFTGSETTTTDTSASGWVDPLNLNNSRRNSDSNNRTTTKSGTTVQLPTFSFVTVTTTVSVPDGGTVLLGGIKRLSEGRNEAGVPILNKIPYLNRLFKNVGIGRETQSLMMMVTPRIIIQEEEEEKLGIPPP